jgi:hypothetical protein
MAGKVRAVQTSIAKENDMKKVTIALLLMLALVFSTVSVAGAITDGTKDGNGHPYVVLLLMDVNHAPAFRCTGTLLSPTVLLTAGHCTSNEPGNPYTGMRIFTQSDLTQGGNTYPYGGGPNSVEAVNWYTLTGAAWFDEPFFMNDAGIVILKSPGYDVPGGVYGKLPRVNQFDSYKTKRGLGDVYFTSVGYGLQQSFPTPASWKDQKAKIRYVANPRLIQINGGIVGDYGMVLSNNANTGGTCFGDSGGPNFVGGTNVIAGVTSFGMNSNCAGTGGVFRVDRQRVQDFIHTYLP